ncbi:MATE family efflux transporter [Methanobrevibacter sp.]|uniref:MATE family efflux transporter n=1 Tax=Methanobrevibacter sp. TaxID=66852 RepID=UPI00388FCCA4
MTYERNFNLLNRKFRELFFPTLMASIAGNFAILVDAFFISMFLGSTFLSVVQSIEPLVAFINAVYWLIGLGESILCKMARADFDNEKGNAYFTISIIATIIVGLIITLSAIIFQDSYVQLLCNSTQLKPFVGQYFFFYALGIVFECYMVCLAYFIKTDGFINMQFRAFLLCNVVNIVFDVILMKFFNMGISGAAIATTIGHIVSAIYITIYLVKSDRTLRFIKIKTSKIIGYLADICKAGFSGSSIPLYTTIRLILLNALIAGILGEMGLSAYNMCYNALYLVDIFILGAVQSILPISAVYYKEEDFNGVDYVTKRSLKIVVAFALFFSALFILFPQVVLFLFNVNNPSDIPVIMNIIRIFSISFIAFAVNSLYMFYAESVQYNKLANMITLLQGLIFPVLFAYLLTALWGADGFWISLVVSEFATVLFIFIYSKIIAHRSNGEYSGFFLNRRHKGILVFEYTITGNIDDAVNLSENIQKLFNDKRISLLVRMAIEDMVVQIININDEIVDLIDVIIKDNDDYILISIKYSGICIDITEDENMESNIAILRNISEKIDYSQILGLNNIIITIK